MRLTNILQRLKASTTFQLSLDLTTEIIWGTSEDAESATTGSGFGRIIPILPRYQRAYLDILGAVARAGCVVRKITIAGNSTLDFYNLTPAALRQIMSPLHEMDIIHSDDFDGPHNLLQCHTRRTMLRAASNLQTLKVVSHSRNDHEFYGADFQIVHIRNTASMLLAAPMSTLTELCLENMAIPQFVIFDMLSKCAGTLTTLTLSEITIDTTSWRGVFRRLMSNCRQLIQVKFERLIVRSDHPDSDFCTLTFGIAYIDHHVDGEVCRHLNSYEILEVDGLQEVQANLLWLSSHHAYFCQGYEMWWQQTGCGSPDFFGISDLEESTYSFSSTNLS
jgi:hypothetical protein